MYILLTGGGTGGHVFPLIAIARMLKKIAKEKGIEDMQMMFAGPGHFSTSIFRKEGIRTKVVYSMKIRRYVSIENLIDLFKMPIGFFQAYWHLLRFMPDIIFAKGGFGSVPSVIVGWFFQVPIIIHESDVYPGLANRLLSRFARVVLVSFEETASYFPKKKTVVIGNPIRERLFKNVPSNAAGILNIQSKQRPLIFVMGGSQGARQINDIILLTLPELMKKYEVVHQCGDKNFDRVSKGAILQVSTDQERSHYHLFGSLNEEELSAAFYLSDIIVSRAGAGAIFEIANAGKPSILIPYEQAAGHHQQKNADHYEEKGAAIVIEKENLTPHLFITAIDNIIDYPEKMDKMSEAARSFVKSDSTLKIAEAILSMKKN